MCEICHRTPCYPRCPNYTPPKSTHYCSICGYGILDGETYILNGDGEYAHYDCIDGKDELLKWLKYDVETMIDATWISSGI